MNHREKTAFSVNSVLSVVEKIYEALLDNELD
jgi:hypothetical protein